MDKKALRRQVLDHLRERYEEEGQYAWLSRDDIAEELGIPPEELWDCDHRKGYNWQAYGASVQWGLL